MATQPNTGSQTYSNSDRSKGGVTSGLSSHSSASGSTTGNTSTNGSTAASSVSSGQGGLASSLADAIDPKTIDRLNHFKDEAWDKASVYFDQSKSYVRSNPFYFIGGAALLGYVLGSMISKNRAQSFSDRSQTI